MVWQNRNPIRSPMHLSKAGLSMVQRPPRQIRLTVWLYLRPSGKGKNNNYNCALIRFWTTFTLFATVWRTESVKTNKGCVTPFGRGFQVEMWDLAIPHSLYLLSIVFLLSVFLFLSMFKNQKLFQNHIDHECWMLYWYCTNFWRRFARHGAVRT